LVLTIILLVDRGANDGPSDAHADHLAKQLLLLLRCQLRIPRLRRRNTVDRDEGRDRECCKKCFFHRSIPQ
jgi:hypothetical protein